MKKKLKLSEILEIVSNAQDNIRKSGLVIFDIMNAIRKTARWTADDFYDSPKYCKVKNVWKEAEFKFVLKEITGWTIKKFNNIEEILKLTNGRKLYMEYGHKNMVHLLGYQPSERKLILGCVEEHVVKNNTVPRFYQIAVKLFPKKHKCVGNVLQKKIEKLEKIIIKLEKNYEEVKKENVILRNEIADKVIELGKLKNVSTSN